jgi:hypothetical protein
MLSGVTLHVCPLQHLLPMTLSIACSACLYTHSSFSQAEPCTSACSSDSSSGVHLPEVGMHDLALAPLENAPAETVEAPPEGLCARQPVEHAARTATACQVSGAEAAEDAADDVLWQQEQCIEWSCSFHAWLPGWAETPLQNWSVCQARVSVFGMICHTGCPRQPHCMCLNPKTR